MSRGNRGAATLRGGRNRGGDGGKRSPPRARGPPASGIGPLLLASRLPRGRGLPLALSGLARTCRHRGHRRGPPSPFWARLWAAWTHTWCLGGKTRALGPAAPLTLLHDLHDLHDFIHVLPGSDETLQHQHLVVVEHVPVQPAHHLEGRGGVGGGAADGETSGQQRALSRGAVSRQGRMGFF